MAHVAILDGEAGQKPLTSHIQSSCELARKLVEKTREVGYFRRELEPSGSRKVSANRGPSGPGSCSHVEKKPGAKAPEGLPQFSGV
jgi:hypothetical protein